MQSNCSNTCFSVYNVFFLIWIQDFLPFVFVICALNLTWLIDFVYSFCLVFSEYIWSGFMSVTNFWKCLIIFKFFKNLVLTFLILGLHTTLDISQQAKKRFFWDSIICVLDSVMVFEAVCSQSQLFTVWRKFLCHCPRDKDRDHVVLLE